MKVAILGCGPAGLLAAQAVSNAGHQPEIFSKPIKSQISGAQYLAKSIHNVTEPKDKFTIFFRKDGDGDTYTRRLYEGRDVPVMSSWHSYEDGRGYDAWSMTAIYDQLWNLYGPMVHPIELDHEGMEILLHEYELVISTIPKHFVVRALIDEYRDPESKFPEGWFEKREVYIQTKNLPNTLQSLDDNTIWYNGTGFYGSMYRASRINGILSAEYTHPQDGCFPIIKPIRYGGIRLGDLYPNLYCVGRYGAWSKMQLVHHAYFKTLNILRPDLAMEAS
jgi:hypothetical protein